MADQGKQFTTITWQADGPVLLLTLNRPDQMNAISDVLEDELQEALQLAVGDDSVRAIVLTGAGNAFSAG